MHLQVYLDQPVFSFQKASEGLNPLHFEVWCLHIGIQLFQIDYQSYTAVLLGHQKEDGVEPAYQRSLQFCYRPFH